MCARPPLRAVREPFSNGKEHWYATGTTMGHVGVWDSSWGWASWVWALGMPMTLVQPTVFQAAGPSVEAIQSSVDAFRAALGDPNNANDPGPLASGRREINWDGGGGIDTTTARSRRSTCSWTAAAASSPPRGRAFRRLPQRAGPRAALQSSSTIRPTQTSSAPSARCACSPRSAATSLRRCSSYPAPMGLQPATVSGFGAVFTDVDRPAGSHTRQIP